MTLMNEKIKAELLSIGTVDVEESLLPPFRTSTAGPGMGIQSVFFTSGHLRVRLEVSGNSPLKMMEKDGHEVILRDGKEIVEGEIEPVVNHCPGQVYITISERCIYNCQFCSVPLSKGHIKTKDEVIAIVEEARRKGKLDAKAAAKRLGSHGRR